MAASQPTLDYYEGDNPHQPDFDPKFTGDHVTRLTCFKAPGVLQVKIVENAWLPLGQWGCSFENDQKLAGATQIIV